VKIRGGLLILLAILFVGCGHQKTCQVGLMSFGDLEGKIIPQNISGPTVTGTDQCKIGADPYYLSEAVRNALKGTTYDTIIDAQVTTETGLFVRSNYIKVSGTALSSKMLSSSEDENLQTQYSSGGE